MELLKKICMTYSPSGNEERICSLIENEVKSYADEVYSDVLGNLIVHKKGNGKKIMIAAHTDEIGVAVTFIDDNGFLRFGAVGGVDAIFALYQKVEFKNGVKGVISYEEDIDNVKNIKISKMFIDIGAKNKEDAQSKVSIGDFACFNSEFTEMGDRISSKSLDNSAGVYVLIEAIKNIEKSDNDLYFVFTSQEEVGLRGARVSAFNIEPDIALCVDVTSVGDTPNAKTMEVKLGGGPAIKVKDSSVICDKDIKEKLIACAKELNLSYQLEILAYGGTDAGVIHTTKYGVKTGAISIPVRYIHSTCETADKSDIFGAIKLLTNFCKC